MRKGYGTQGSKKDLEDTSSERELPPFPKKQMLILGWSAYINLGKLPVPVIWRP